MLVERELSVARSHPDMKDIVQLRTMRKSPLLLKIMESLYSEAADAEVPVQGQPHHNQFFNFYVHKQDDLCKRALDVSPIEIPSQLYYFEFLRKPLPRCAISSPVKDLRNCIVHIHSLTTSVSESVLSACQQISRFQPITDLWIFKMNCDLSAPTDVFRMSSKAQSIRISASILNYTMLDHLVQQLSRCRDLKKLHLREIKFCNAPSKCTSQNVDENRNVPNTSLCVAALHLCEAIKSWGDNPALQSLSLRNCSIPEPDCYEILRALSACKNLTYLDLGGNCLGNSGKHLVQIIENMGPNPSLQELHLENFSLPEEVCCDLMKSARKCMNLKGLNLTGNPVGKAGKHIADVIRNLQPATQLESLYLRNCSMLDDIWVNLLKSLGTCRNIGYLDLSGHKIGKALIWDVQFATFEKSIYMTLRRSLHLKSRHDGILFKNFPSTTAAQNRPTYYKSIKVHFQNRAGTPTQSLKLMLNEPAIIPPETT